MAAGGGGDTPQIGADKIEMSELMDPPQFILLETSRTCEGCFAIALQFGQSECPH